MQDKNERVYWLDRFEGAAKGGGFYRSSIHIDIEEFESKFKEKVVAIKLTPKKNSGKASYTVEFVIDATEEMTKLRAISDVK